jgi:4'-phosphopantetheinyl transferase
VILQQDDVHVWYASLDGFASSSRWLARTLNADERARSERFYFEQDRVRFIAGRGLLRTILGYYSGIEPGDLQFCYSSHGKPSLAETFKGSRIRFNLAHAHGFALYAVTFDREIGVDLEYIKPIAEAARIVHRFFSDQENTAFHTFTSDEKLEAFFRYWTCKEAYLKACGEGLTHPLDQIEISLVPGEPATLLSIRGDVREASRWFLQELHPATDLAAALVVEGSKPRLTCWQMPSVQRSTGLSS